MKIKLVANELVDGEIEFISLVKHGANRSPFVIVKAEEETAPSPWAGLLPELDRLQKRFAGWTGNADTEKAQVTKNDEFQQIQAQEIAELRHSLSGLYAQQQSLWERPNTPAFQKFDDDLTFRIEKAESELRLLTSDEDQMKKSSAFFRRGGTSSYSAGTVIDSAMDQKAAELRKAEDEIDLNTRVTSTDPEEVAKVDLNSISF
jgi:hypothetical protein